MSNAKRVFLSSAIEDRSLAKDLAKLMSTRGVSVFLDTDPIQPGDQWFEIFRREIEKASALLFLIPSNEVSDRNNIWFEAGAAKALGKRVLALLPPHRHLVNLPTDVADVVVLDADKRPLERIADTLIEAVPDLAEGGL